MGDHLRDVASLIDDLKTKDVGSGQMSKNDCQTDLWLDGLICAFELIRAPGLHKSGSRTYSGRRNGREGSRLGITNFNQDNSRLDCSTFQLAESNTKDDNKFLDKESEIVSYTHWVPIGWSRISELVQRIEVDENCASMQINFSDETTVADIVAPYWERPVGPTWWCHVAANHPSVVSWLSSAQWLYPAISVALRDESRLMSERMKYLLYEVPVRVAGGLLFELLGQSVGDPNCNEDDIPIVLRSWKSQNFLITSMHVKGATTNHNALGITEVQEFLLTGGSAAPKSIDEVIAHLVCRLSRWDDRLFRKFVFGAADEIELKFVNRRNYEDLNLLCVILNQEIRRLAKQVIRVKWSLHAREEIVFELLQHLRGPVVKSMLGTITKSTRQMLEEQEAVRGRLFTIQDVMQSAVRAMLQDTSIRVTHNLTIFGGCGLVLSIITGLFGINVDGIPGAQNTPYAFSLFTGILFAIGITLIAIGMIYFGLKKPINERKVNVRKLELDMMVSMFQQEAENHAKVREGISRGDLPPNVADMMHYADYIVIDG